MLENETPKSVVQNNTNENNVCNFAYLSEMMGGKKHLIKEIMDVFLTQVSKELQTIEEATAKSDYATIKNIAHTMKSSCSIMGINALTPVLNEIESLAAGSSDTGNTRDERIKQLNGTLSLICQQAVKEIEEEIQNYI